MKLECQQLCSSSLQQELEAALAQLEKHQANREKRQAEIHTKKTSELTLLNDDLKAEIGKLGVRRILWGCAQSGGWETNLARVGLGCMGQDTVTRGRLVALATTRQGSAVCVPRAVICHSRCK